MINDLQSVYSVKVEGCDIAVDDIKDLPVITHRNGIYTVLVDHTLVRLEVIGHSILDRTLTVKINQETYNAVICRNIDRLVATMGLENKLSQKIEFISSPMPGLVKRVLIQAGEQVTAGQSLIILEAMKMENIIKSPINGHIKSIHFTAGDPVNKSDVLIRFNI